MFLHADWRSLVGLTSRDEGSLVERVLTNVVMDVAFERHADVQRAMSR